MHHSNSDQATKLTAILNTLASIPAGKVTSYGDIAKRSGFPGLARYVAYVLKNLPSDSTIPWHRVINSQRKISFPKNSHMHHHQRTKLLAEGIIFTDANTIPTKYFW